MSERDMWAYPTKDPAEAKAVFESLRTQLAEVTAERDRLRESLLFLDQQGYDHHTPHMICVLKPDWKKAMKPLQESAPDE